MAERTSAETSRSRVEQDLVDLANRVAPFSEDGLTLFHLAAALDVAQDKLDRIRTLSERHGFRPLTEQIFAILDGTDE